MRTLFYSRPQRHVSICVVITSAAVLCSNSWAQTPAFQFNGYGTLGAAWSDNGDANYTPDPSNPKGPGRRNHLDTGLDTRLAGQFSANLDDKLSAVVQVVVERKYDGNFEPVLEWANIKYQINDQFFIRAGRTVLDTFLMSDHRKVAYTLPWVRPPAELYQLIPVTNSDGVDVSYQFHRNNQTYTLAANYGRTLLDEPGRYVDAPNLWGIHPRFESGALTIKASYTSYKLVYQQVDQLWDAFRQLGPAGEAIVTRYNPRHRRTVFTSLALDYNPGNWFTIAEWGRSELHSDFGARAGWYISSGIVLGNLTPYATLARANGGHSSVTGLDAAAFPTATQATIALLNNSLLDIQDSLALRQTTVSTGIRWDIQPGVSTKLQLDRVSTTRQSSGTFTNLRFPRNPGTTHVLSLTADWVF